MIKFFRRARILMIDALARRSYCITHHYGLTGLMGATVIEGEHKGRALGTALALARLT